MEIKICGPGCPKCTLAAANVEDALAEANITAQVEKITDFADMARLGVLSTPAVIIDGEVKCVGKAPSKNEILAWLT